MNVTTFAVVLEWDWLMQGTFCLGLGLVGSLLLRRHAARAHQVLRLGMLAAILLPSLSAIVQRQGLGLLPAAAKPESISVLRSDALGLPVHTSPLAADRAFAVDSASPVAEPGLVAPSVEPESKATVGVSPSSRRFSGMAFVGAVWLVIGLIFLFRLSRTVIMGLRLLRRAEPCERSILIQALQRARTRLSVRAHVTLKESGILGSPVIWCWRSGPVILVQRDIERCPHTDWVSVFCHELAHWKRGDHISGLEAELWLCVFWWHPLVWWAKKRLEILSEQACDDWVLACGQSGPDYAESLLGLAPEAQRAFIPTVVGKDKTMKERIIRIIKQQSGNPRVGGPWALFVILLTGFLIVGSAFAQRRAPRPEREQPEGWGGGAFVDRRGEAVHQEILADKIRDVRAELKDAVKELHQLQEKGRGDSSEAHLLRSEIKLNEAILRQIKQRQAALQRRPERPDRREALAREVEEIEAVMHEAAEALHDLEEEGEGDSRAARNNRQTLERMERRMHQLQREMEALERRQENPLREVGMLHRMEQVRAKLEGSIRELHALEERDRGDSDEAHRLRREIEELDRALHETEQAFHALERHQGEHTQDERRARLHELEVQQHQLHEHTRHLEEKLDHLGDEHPERSEGIRRELEEIRNQLERIERARHEMQHPESQLRPELEAMEHRHRELEIKAGGIHRAMEALGDSNPEIREGLERQFHELRAQMERIERDVHGERPGNDRGDLEVRVDELNEKVEHLGNEMREIRGLLEQLVRQQRRALFEVEEEEVERRPRLRTRREYRDRDEDPDAHHDDDEDDEHDEDEDDEDDEEEHEDDDHR